MMNQIYNDAIMMIRMAAERPNAAPKEEPSDTSFRDLMEKQQRPAAEQEDVEQTQVVSKETTEQEEAPVFAANDPEMQEQMLLAALATLQNPVVPMEQVTTLEQVTETAAPVVLQTGNPETVETVAVEVPVMETKELGSTPAQAEIVRPANVQQEPQQMELKQEYMDQKPVEQSEAPKGNVESAETETPVFGEVQEVPVKVGEAPVTAEEQVMETAKPVETQVREKLTQALDRGETRVEIQLEPENLGRVRVELTRGQDGLLHVALRAENSQTQTLLEKDASGLQALLMRNTQQEVQVEVSPQQESQRQDFEDGRQHGQQQDPQQQKQERKQNGLDFLQQLRLGLIPLDGEAS